MNVPLTIQLSPSADDGDMNMKVAKAVQKEEMARAMRSGNVQQMRALAEKLQKSAAVAEFAADIVILLQLAKDFEDRREDVRMNSMQMAQECSNNRSMQSATRFMGSKAAMCSPSVVLKSKSASDDVSAKMSKGFKMAGGSAQSTPVLNMAPWDIVAATPATVSSAQQPGAPDAPQKDDAAAPASGIIASMFSGIRSMFGGSSSEPDMQ